MNALALLTSRDGAPPARASLISLNERIAAAEKHLGVLINGRDRLRAELSRADTARNELDSWSWKTRPRWPGSSDREPLGPCRISARQER
jgi:hypothetical protein